LTGYLEVTRPLSGRAGNLRIADNPPLCLQVTFPASSEFVVAETPLQGNTLQGHDWLALDGERIVILATPAIAFRERGGRENYTQGAVN
jgi:hypothetical protein